MSNFQPCSVCLTDAVVEEVEPGELWITCGSCGNVDRAEVGTS